MQVVVVFLRKKWRWPRQGRWKEKGRRPTGKYPLLPTAPSLPLDAGHRNAKSEPVGKWGHQAGNTRRNDGEIGTLGKSPVVALAHLDGRPLCLPVLSIVLLCSHLGLYLLGLLGPFPYLYLAVYCTSAHLDGPDFR
ncbi:hypothetical protein K456DRAFT_1923560, partial [Colletotrichum gloeosporioides 23]